MQRPGSSFCCLSTIDTPSRIFYAYVYCPCVATIPCGRRSCLPGYHDNHDGLSLRGLERRVDHDNRDGLSPRGPLERGQLVRRSESERYSVAMEHKYESG